MGLKSKVTEDRHQDDAELVEDLLDESPLTIASFIRGRVNSSVRTTFNTGSQNPGQKNIPGAKNGFEYEEKNGLRIKLPKIKTKEIDESSLDLNETNMMVQDDKDEPNTKRLQGTMSKLSSGTDWDTNLTLSQNDFSTSVDDSVFDSANLSNSSLTLGSGTFLSKSKLRNKQIKISAGLKKL